MTMTDTNNLAPPSNDYDYDGWADFWRHKIGVNVIPADTQKKVTYESWSEWQNKPIPEELHNEWKTQKAFSNGIAIIPGKVWHRADKIGLYFTFIDLDTKYAIGEICTLNGKMTSLQEIAQKFIVEQHRDDLDKAHLYFYSPIAFANKSSDVNTAIEVKGLGEHGIAFCSPSIHKNKNPDEKNEYRYEIMGTTQPITLTVELAEELMQHINTICKKHNVEYLDKHYKNLLDSDSKIYQGSRHDSMISIANSLLFRYYDNGRSEQELKNVYIGINDSRCKPPLPVSEMNRIWKDCVAYYSSSRIEQVLEQEEGEKKKKNDSEPSSSHAQKALAIAKQNCRELFLDQYGMPYAAIEVNGHLETLALNGKRFRNWLFKIYYDAENSVVNSESVTNVLNILKAQAEFGGSKRKELHLRVCGTGSSSTTNSDSYKLLYDLTNPEWDIVEITADNGWHVTKAPAIFRRYSNQQAQVYPSKEYPSDIFDRFMELMNIKDEENRLLLKCYIIALLVPEIPKPILMLHGEQGSAKSTLQELIKMLVDPSIMHTLSFPTDINELIQKLAHNYVAYFDNVSEIKEWISDQLCRAVTGSAFSKRELWTDDDDIIYSFKRCIGFNGINLGATKADLLERGLIIELEHIPDEKKRLLADIWKDFERIRPQLLGYIFDVLSKVLHAKKKHDGNGNGGHIGLKGHPRMADYAEVAELISRCMGYADNQFINTYYKNIGLQTEEVLEANPIGIAVVKLMHSRTQWIGNATELLQELNQIAEVLKIDMRSNLWPKAPNILSRRLKDVKTNLRRIGIFVERPIDTETNTKFVEIQKISPESPASPEYPNYLRSENENTGDTVGDTRIEKIVSPEKSNNNQAQNEYSGDTSDIGDSLQSLAISNIYQQQQQNNVTNAAINSFSNNIQQGNGLTVAKTIYRLGHSDTFGCHSCKQKGDKWFMQKHFCQGLK